MKKTRTHARPVEQNLLFAICLFTMYIFNRCVGGSIPRASLCLRFTFGGACYRYLLVTVLSLNGCADYNNCTCNLLSSLDQYHHTCTLIFPAFSSNQLIPSRCRKRVLLWAVESLLYFHKKKEEPYSVTISPLPSWNIVYFEQSWPPSFAS